MEDCVLSEQSRIDISYKPSPYSRKNQIGRVLWGVTYALLFRPSPRPLHSWRRMLLRLFGAQLGRNAKVFSSAKIWAPWNLELGDYSTIAPEVDCYSAGKISIGSNTTVSQYSYLCAASHDHNKAKMPLYTAPITIGSQVWICADVFVGPGVSIGEGTVVGARSSVFRDLPPWSICVGSPATVRGPRVVT
ncbi:putative colanic acid biosynthesis acetyltransferase WcaF [Bradyrhizobium sp. JR4.1]|uniref:putative colanic acid biosynthesis acetyltransferase n=1 Tax=Bradyrhizobium sp. JR4.1 TaxID=3156372 RepID=UPI0033923E7C